mmetsp:Transcript_35188/g.74954  ORF Transcript_35188/g.74954 Transcript_35188/m.74954 type:complete len:247 (+) Transcript_35188:128-868(+)
MEEDALSASSFIAGDTGVTASTASGSGHDTGEAATPVDASETSVATPTTGAALQKHPLQHAWCLWVLLHNQSTKEDWQNSQMNIQTWSTVEDFWRLFNNIKSPSRLGISDFSVFKKDIAPAWEDETCRHGGRWLAKIDKMRPQVFDDLWLTVILTMIGETLGDVGHCACGAVVSTRAKNSKMALWISEREESKVMPIGRAFHKILQDAGFTGDITFENFAQDSQASQVLFSLKGAGTAAKAKGTAA